MSHSRRTSIPSIEGQPLTIWLSSATLKWLALQGEVSEVAADLIERASTKARTPTEPRTRAWRNPDYETASLPPKPPEFGRTQPRPKVVSIPNHRPGDPNSDTPALRFNVIIQQMRLKPSWEYTHDEDGWMCILRINGKQYIGVGGTKKTAKQKCCKSFLEEMGSFA
ncbi:MAG: double-stranded RNA binding motif domain-containing protein [Elainellaceae cyanobacterium]